MARGRKNGGGRGGGVRARQLENARHREALERAFATRMIDAPDHAPLVVARSARREPFHRWLSYRQGFAPELVRRFLGEASIPDGVILDPFSGSGTVPTEAARAGRVGLGIDAVGSLSVMARARALDPPGTMAIPSDANPEAAYGAATTTSERAAVLIAAASMVDGEGHTKKNGIAFSKVLADTLEFMREDTRRDDRPLGSGFAQGDARRLPLGDRTIAGVLTSPPYLSRYDYARVNDPAERLWRGRGRRAGRKRQLRASRVASRRHGDAGHEAAREAAERLEEDGRHKEADAALAYLADMEQVVSELGRVMQPGAPLWMVVAGAELKKTYVPCDLIIAAACDAAGLAVEEIRVARTLKQGGRRLGGLDDIAPREVVIVARRT